MVESLRRYMEASNRQLNEVEARLGTRRAERDSYAALLGRALEVERAYSEWQQQRAALESLDALAASFHNQEKRLAEPREQIQAARGRLEQELGMLQEQAGKMARLNLEEPLIRNQIDAAQLRLAGIEGELDQRKEMEAMRQALREEWVELKAAIQAAEKEQTELAERLQALESIEGAACPLCGQPLSAADRQGLAGSLQGQEEHIQACLLEWQTRLRK